MGIGLALIVAERERQIEKEGFTPAHDDHHSDHHLRWAADCYRHANTQIEIAGLGVPVLWPWERSWWKPSKDPVRNLVKAGALYYALADKCERAGRDDDNELLMATVFEIAGEIDAFS